MCTGCVCFSFFAFLIKWPSASVCINWHSINSVMLFSCAFYCKNIQFRRSTSQKSCLMLTFESVILAVNSFQANLAMASFL